MKSTEIRKKFVSFFESKGHKRVNSASLIPGNDPTLLFTNAGMVQFKDAFTGAENPAAKRVTTVQKCVRAGGKHNDLENVGFTARHHTFFEMLGNFSFGDYFKKEAIGWAWEFITKELKIPKDKLYVTVHHSDQEAADIWHEQEGVPKDRIFFFGDKDNFWEMGEVGPCGPCSEIFYDHGPEHGDPTVDTSECVLADEARYVEIWNLVFMQFEKYKENGEIKQRPLPKPSVDTGGGLERFAAALQGTYNNFDTDCFTPIIAEIEKHANIKYKDHPQWFRVVADHVRCATMLISDGVLPSNEGRGYVLRRIIRRGVRHLDLLGIQETCLYTLVSTVFATFGDNYPENKKEQKLVEKYLKLEEENFRKTLSSGIKLLNQEIEGLKSSGKNVLDGKSAFTLYDTHGFPADLTSMILAEQELAMDHEGFEKCMEEQKERSRKGSDFSAGDSNVKEFYAVKEKHGETEFLGYKELESHAKLLAKIPLGEKTAVIFDKTPFYAEGGGQVGDQGWIFEGENSVVEVLDTQSPVDKLSVHLVKDGSVLTEGKRYLLKVDSRKRALTASNHTATHLLQAALMKVLGDHINQAGSSVGPDRLRFDFTHPESVKKDQLRDIEKLVNKEIQKRTSVTPEIMTKEAAIEKGAKALFGEKYGNQVRVIDVPGFSLELCGGTHVHNTAEIGYFKLLSESSLSSGVRRIEAVTNAGAYEYVDSKLESFEKVEAMLKVKGPAAGERVEQLLAELQAKTKEIKSLKDKIQSAQSGDLFKDIKQTKDGHDYIYIKANKDADPRKLGDLFMDKHPKGLILITSERGESAQVLLKTFKGNDKFNCKDVFNNQLKELGGRGGGKPDMAQGSLPSSNVANFVKSVESLIF